MKMKAFSLALLGGAMTLSACAEVRAVLPDSLRPPPQRQQVVVTPPPVPNTPATGLIVFGGGPPASPIQGGNIQPVGPSGPLTTDQPAPPTNSLLTYAQGAQRVTVQADPPPPPIASIFSSVVLFGLGD